MTFLRILLVIAVLIAALVAAILFSGREVGDVAEEAVDEVQDVVTDEENADTVDEPRGETAIAEDGTPAEQAMLDIDTSAMVNEPAAEAMLQAREAIILADEAGNQANRSIAAIGLAETDPLVAAKDAERLAIGATRAAEEATAAAREAVAAANDADAVIATLPQDQQDQARQEAEEAETAADEAVAASLDAEAYAREAVNSAAEAIATAEGRPVDPVATQNAVNAAARQDDSDMPEGEIAEGEPAAGDGDTP